MSNAEVSNQWIMLTHIYVKVQLELRVEAEAEAEAEAGKVEVEVTVGHKLNSKGARAKAKTNAGQRQQSDENRRSRTSTFCNMGLGDSISQGVAARPPGRDGLSRFPPAPLQKLVASQATQAAGPASSANEY